MNDEAQVDSQSDSDINERPSADDYDVRIEEVGDRAQVAVGKDIKQTSIGQVIVNVFRAPSQRPIILLLLATLVGVLGIYFWLLKPTRPEKMTSQFNVAVAEFSFLDADGRRVRSDDGLALATHLYQQLDNSFASFDLAPISYEIWPPEYTGQVNGSSREERYSAAEKLAQQINAHVVIYGVLEAEGEHSSFSPEFYINHSAFEQASEITGEYRMGRPLLVNRPFVLDISNQSPALTARVEALSLIAIGLAYYSIDDYDGALGYFQQAADNERWLPTAGKEIIYLLLGNAAQRKAAVELDTTGFGVARDHYKSALELNPEFARAKLGEAAMLYALALGDLNDSSLAGVDVDLLAEAEDCYRMALTLDDAALGANIVEKYHFGLGQIFLVRAQISDGAWLEQAEQEFSTVISEYENGNERLAEVATHAYARLALISILREDYSRAIERYELAAEKASPYSKAMYQASIGEIYLSLGDNDKAVESYEYAVGLAESIGDAESTAEYLERLEELRLME